MRRFRWPAAVAPAACCQRLDMHHTQHGEQAVQQGPRASASLAFEGGSTAQAALRRSQLGCTPCCRCREILRNSPTALRFLKAAMNAAEDGQAGIQEMGGCATSLFYQSEEGNEVSPARQLCLLGLCCLPMQACQVYNFPSRTLPAILAAVRADVCNLASGERPRPNSHTVGGLSVTHHELGSSAQR